MSLIKVVRNDFLLISAEQVTTCLTSDKVSGNSDYPKQEIRFLMNDYSTICEQFLRLTIQLLELIQTQYIYLAMTIEALTLQKGQVKYTVYSQTQTQSLLSESFLQSQSLWQTGSSTTVQSFYL